MLSIATYAVRDGELVTINVEAGFSEYKVHKKLLVEHLEYFTREPENYISLEDVESDVFDIFIDWLYTQELPQKAIEWVSDEQHPACYTELYTEDTHTAGEYFRWEKQLQQTKAYVFGGRFQSPAFQKAVYKTILDELDDLPFYEAVTWAFANLPAEDPLLQLMVDANCHSFSKESDSPQEVEDRKQLPHEFLVRVMLRYGDLVSKHDREPLDAANYQLRDEKDEDKQPSLMMAARKYAGFDMDTDGDWNSDSGYNLNREMEYPWETACANV
ncbi:hypothetical protein N0V95_002001 [Ascochyta clinopodiicola]|nr:hypothetical protein N0V95_002001 [Ascochyta clinopodiicola]